ncbi:MAG: DUF502 domain-containing protein [Thalassobaculaceae bacterium]
MSPKLDSEARPRRTFWGRLRGYFFAGVLITGPISITLYLVWLFISYVDSAVNPWIPAAYNPSTYVPFSIPGVGLVVGLFLLTFIGWITAGLLGSWLIRFSEGLLARMPVVRNIYSTIKQLMETMLSQKSNAFRQCALVEWPRAGMWTVGFVTGDTTGELSDKLGGPQLSIYVPTTPNPTSGYLIFLPPEQVKILDMSVEEGLKYVISTGIVQPENGQK